MDKITCKIINNFLTFLAVINLLAFTAQAQDSIVRTDSVKILPDSSNKKIIKISDNAVESKVVYTSKDSVMNDIKEKKVYLFGDAEITYENINVKASYIEIDFNKNLMFASGIKDSTGKVTGKPVFTEDEQSFNSDNITFNFNTKKGIIKKIITQQGDGFIHGNTVKKFPDNVINIKNGSYTTCSDEHPHFDIRFSRAKVIPDDKIVTGPALLYIEDVPTPLVVPFGFFPNKKGRKSGILIPSYGESANRGFFFENGGYYFAISDYIDLALRGDIFTGGSWAIKTASDYAKKYKYRGNFNLNYAENILGEKGLPDYSKKKDFFVKWQHTQSDKASPGSRFSANVNAGSSSYNAYNPSSTSDYLSNTFQSNISYSKMWAGKYSLSTNLRHSQNTINKMVNLSLPEVAFSVSRFYPFRKKEKVGQSKWYENISANYVMNCRNDINVPDSVLFTHEALSKFNNGMRHSIPISSTTKVFKYFTWTNSANLTGRWYLKTIDKTWHDTIFTSTDTILPGVVTDTVNGFRAAWDYNFSSSINTMLYGMASFKRGPVRAIRHVLTPSVSFVYTPDFGTKKSGYYKSYYDSISDLESQYSIFSTGIYGSPPSDKSGMVNFSLSNNLEMKVRTRKDTVSGVKKVVLIDNLTISTGYNLARDSLNWDMLSVRGRTKLLKNVDLRYSSTWDPYTLNYKGQRINRTEWDKNHYLYRLDNNSWELGINLNLNSETLFKKADVQNQKKEEEQAGNNISWIMNIYYSLRYTNAYYTNYMRYMQDTVQTLSFSGEVNITSKWKVGFTSGYDFQNKDFSYTSLNFYRDLHCWEMLFNWIPFGFRKSYNLTIKVKSSILQDLKITKKTDWRDY